MATWNTNYEATPAGSDQASTLDDRIREDKNETRVRADREHVWLNPTQTTGGYHRAGSAKVYFTTATPANRPDGTVALDSDDKGRLWFRSSNGTLLVHNGTSFISTGVTLSTAQTISGAKAFQGNVRMSAAVLHTGRTRFLLTTGASHNGIKAIFSSLVPLSNDSIVVSGVIHDYTATLTLGTNILIRVLRSTSGSIYFLGAKRVLDFIETGGVGFGYSAQRMKVSTGTALFPSAQVKFMGVSW